ncbi:MAG: hypothetical protein GW772_10980 [Flavobacteriia bacterium]|nr:hypothetical protein [Flavobacteriia bacterium]OIP45548.1 MAG: hypothetical protein AUK46_11940 [Flavobacteriaceae bacterium CG2_30_31_66]PIV96801.1 MAG: hypothetical protein COW43_06550 [Flavobacteriaceae bacterium CG17_big_fil_post_rev_8_21_14_2_50_31_13]PIX12000.1 MAG: hypothetical protein COZ74_12530 [Flavobacteriaceae bacterium CG_4_8_14_3_um_filter_31_8]PIY14974.1 MAG: hypothetical protein COZ16_06755 [Flavobacteriaceae bacterium CG_4_10_14_3_um_filter_31_253]PIZ11666.1 MAG: hypotheti
MKIFLLILLMFFTLSSFANNSISLKERKIQKIGFQIDNLENQISVINFDWVARCYVTIRNSETGETRRVYGIGSGSTQSEAASNCGKNAYRLALTVVDNLN